MQQQPLYTEAQREILWRVANAGMNNSAFTDYCKENIELAISVAISELASLTPFVPVGEQAQTMSAKSAEKLAGKTVSRQIGRALRGVPREYHVQIEQAARMAALIFHQRMVAAAQPKGEEVAVLVEALRGAKNTIQYFHDREFINEGVREQLNHQLNDLAAALAPYSQTPEKK